MELQGTVPYQEYLNRREEKIAHDTKTAMQEADRIARAEEVARRQRDHNNFCYQNDIERRQRAKRIANRKALDKIYEERQAAYDRHQLRRYQPPVPRPRLDPPSREEKELKEQSRYREQFLRHTYWLVEHRSEVTITQSDLEVRLAMALPDHYKQGRTQLKHCTGRVADFLYLIEPPGRSSVVLDIRTGKYHSQLPSPRAANRFLCLTESPELVLDIRSGTYHTLAQCLLPPTYLHGVWVPLQFGRLD